MKLRSFKYVVVAVTGILACGLTACGNSTVSPAIAADTPKVAVAPSDESQGADAAPQLQVAPAANGYDNSQKAKDVFVMLWAYEVQTPEDRAMGSDRAYNAGAAMCQLRATHSTEALIEATSGEMGITLSGASAIYKAAVVVLCPQYDVGYKTYFDRNVDKFFAAANLKVSYSAGPPSIYAYGYFMKETCDAMSRPSIGGAGIYSHMRSQTQLTLMAQGNVSEQVLYIYIREAVSAGCYALLTQLPPVIQMS